MSMLLLERGDDRQDPLDVAAATLAVGPEADLPPDDRAAQSTFGRVVRWLHALGVDEGPEGRLVLQDLLGHALDLGVAAHRRLAEQAANRPLQALHPALKRAARERSVANAVPPPEHDLRPREQLLADLAARPAALCEAGEIADQVRPTQLAHAACDPPIGRPAVHHQE